MKNLIILKPLILSVFISVILFGIKKTTFQKHTVQQELRFIAGDSGAYHFDTGVLKGTLRQSGKSTGITPITYNGNNLAMGEGLYNHYRVFTKGKRYGYGARRWPSTAKLHTNGDVEVVWAKTSERPFELRVNYHWVSSNTLDVTTTVHAHKNLKMFEVFLASYFDHTFNESQVWTSQDAAGVHIPGFFSAKRTFGEWLAFPRNEAAITIINDGRWDLEPHPLAWTIMPEYDKPIALRRDLKTGITAVLMSKPEDCFGVFTPYNEDKHFSNYFSLFGHDIASGQTANAHSRLIVLSEPTDQDILNLANAFFNEK